MVNNKSDKEPKSKNKLPDHSHNGHRQRVRNRYYETGFDGMPDHNILELLLFHGIPRKDTNQIAHDLIDTFGSFEDVIQADRVDLMKVKGMTESAACLISMILPIYSRYVENLYSRMPDSLEPHKVAEYLRPKFFAGGCRERVFVLCYDYSDHLITCRQISEGDVSSTNFDLRKLGEIVLETNCASVILAHNHPHSIALPSNDDIEATSVIAKFLSMFKVSLRDHIIVSDDDFNSFAKNTRTMHIIYGLHDTDERAVEAKDYKKKVSTASAIELSEIKL